MFCGKCGAKNADDATVCVECGAKLNNGPAAGGSSAPVNPDNKNRKVGMIAVAAVVVVVIIAVVALTGGRSDRATVEQFITAQFDADAETVIDLIPRRMIDYALEEEGYGEDGLEELIEDANNTLQNQLDEIERYLGDDWDLSYEILGEEDTDETVLEDPKRAYEEYDVNISDAKTVEVEVSVGANGMASSNSMDIALIKSGRSWYLDIVRMGNIL